MDIRTEGHETSSIKTLESNEHTHIKKEIGEVKKIYFVCVEVLRPSQPNRVMSSAVSLPNYTFTGQA